jgi:hypothetical protein
MHYHGGKAQPQPKYRIKDGGRVSLHGPVITGLVLKVMGIL